jgi:hypothetical protein
MGADPAAILTDLLSRVEQRARQLFAPAPLSRADLALCSYAIRLALKVLGADAATLVVCASCKQPAPLVRSRYFGTARCGACVVPLLDDEIRRLTPTQLQRLIEASGKSRLIKRRRKHAT